MRSASTRTAIAATLLGSSMSVWALGVGPARVTAVLGQPLDALVPIHGDAGEPVALECVEAKVFFGEDRLGGDQVRLRLEAAPAGSAERLLHVVTTSVVNEPVVSLRVTAGCGSAVVREFVAFVELAGAQKALPLASSATTVVPQALPVQAPARHVAVPIDRPAAKEAGSAADSAPTVRRAASRSETAAPTKVAPAPAAAAAAATRAKPAPRPETAPRLQLDPLLPVGAAATGGELGNADATGALSRQGAADAARLQALEATLAEVRSEMALTRRTLEGLEARARAAEQDRGLDSVSYALAALGIALSAALGWLLLERRRERTAAAWDEGLRAMGLPEPVAAPAAEPASEAASAANGGARVGEGDAEPEPPAKALPASATGVAPAPGAAAASKRYPLLEELLDLDQQAAFLVALGQEQAATGLLQEHLDRQAGTGPLPWLELLALHQRRGERPAFDDVGRRFAERFDTDAPAWAAELEQGCALEDYPAVIERLEWAWHSPDEVAGLLDALLLRSGGRDNMPDLPACRDLLLLYALVRERLGNETFAAALDEELPWSFHSAKPSRRLAHVTPGRGPDLPPMPWPGENLRLPEDFGARVEAAAPPETAAVEEPLPRIDFEPLQFEPSGLAVPGVRS